MKIDGKAIAEKLYADLQSQVKQEAITPQLGVILVGDDPATASYVRQKQKWAEVIGAKVHTFLYPTSSTTEQLLQKIQELNMNPTFHGIILQRPLPSHIDKTTLQAAVTPEKDVDGFHPQSPFAVPVALAVVRALKEVYEKTKGTKDTEGTKETNEAEELHVSKEKQEIEEVHSSFVPSAPFGPSVSSEPSEPFLKWLKAQKIVVVGKGETAGGPIIRHFRELGLQPIIIDSKTPNPQEITQAADILITAVGKPHIITPENITHGASIIGVGMHMTNEGKLHGDFDEQAVENVASYYTPSPGGIGPINVAYLMENLVTAAKS